MHSVRTTFRVIRPLGIPVVAVVFATAFSARAVAWEKRIPLRVAIHVHTTFSNGSHSIEEVAEMAHRRGVDVLVPTDHLLTKATYGVAPLRGVLKVSEGREGILDHGVERYLDAIRRAGEKYPGLIIIPGAEAKPFYYWSGSLWRGTLTLRRFDHHLLLVGGDDPDFYRYAPVLGNRRAERLGLPSILLVWPVAALACAVWLLARRGRRSWPVWALAGLSAVGFWNNFPFTYPQYDQYSGPQGIEPYQKLIDYAVSRGSLVFWSYPEAWVPRIRKRGVTMLSSRHPEDLLRSDGYTGFEALYGDFITALRPGQEWDMALLEYCRGLRRSAPWGITGLNFHAENLERSWFRVDAGATVVLARERSRSAVLDALRRGEFYATATSPAGGCTLEEMVVAVPSGQEALPGGALAWSPGASLRLAFGWPGGIPRDARLVIVKSGKVWKESEIEVPARIELPIDAPDNGVTDYYRFQLSGNAGLIVSNPIFVSSRPR